MPQSVLRGTVTLDAQLLAGARRRTASLGLRINLYIAVLIRNDLLKPAASLTIGVDAGPKRVELPLSLPQKLRRDGSHRAFQLAMNFSRYIEALIDADLSDPSLPLPIHPSP